jgi:hypothetical protein
MPTEDRRGAMLDLRRPRERDRIVGANGTRVRSSVRTVLEGQEIAFAIFAAIDEFIDQHPELLTAWRSDLFRF